MSDFRPYRPEDPSGRPFDGDSFGDWKGNLSDAELQLQSDLSCLVDDELDEVAAARVMVQMEESPECRAFFEDARTCLLYTSPSPRDKRQSRMPSSA